MPFLSISCVRIQTAAVANAVAGAGAGASAGSLCCSGGSCAEFLSGITAKSQCHNMAACRTTHPLVAAAICLLCRISWAANCFFFISSGSSRGSSIRSSHIVLGSSSGLKCHSNSLLRFILPLIRRSKTLGKAGTGAGAGAEAGGQWQMRVSTAIVARVCARKEDLLRRRARFLVLGWGCT